MRFTVIRGANLTLKCPPSVPNCKDIQVLQEEFDGVTYRTMELEFTPDERKAVAEGGTLLVRQVGGMWVPVAHAVMHADGTIADAD